MSALFHLYLCGRIAAEWLIKMDQQEKPTKFLYLPQAKNDHFIIGGADDRPDASVPGSEPEPGPEEPTGIYPCPCCGYLTLSLIHI